MATTGDEIAVGTMFDSGLRRCAVCTRRWSYLDVERRRHGWCDCGGGLQYIAVWDLNEKSHHDPGDEDRSER